MKKGKLKNNLRYLIYNNNSKYSVNILLLVKVGSINEVKGKYGLAHFLEHMLFKGTKKYPKSKLLTDLIYKYGGSTNAFTTYDVTGYYITINSKYTELAISFLSDIFFNSIFIDYVKEKGVVISENKKNMSNPVAFANIMYDKLIYKCTNYEHSIGGTNSDVKKFTKKDFMDFYKKHYIPSNCVLSVCGRIIKDVDKLIIKYFSKNIKSITDECNINYDLMSMQKSLRFKSIIKPIQQANIYMGYPCYADKNNKKKICTLDIISTALGGNMSSRLFIKLREEQGLVYTVSCSQETTYDVGTFTIYFGTFNNKIKKATTLILKEIEKIKKKGLDKKELKRTVDYIIGINQLSSEDNETYNTDIAWEYLYFNKITELKEYEKIYKSIKNEDIINVAKEIFNNTKLNYCVLANKKIKCFIK